MSPEMSDIRESSDSTFWSTPRGKHELAQAE